jgi:hypothetical protein
MLGGEVVEFPTIEIRPPQSYEPLDRAIQRISNYDWLMFTSVNGVEQFLNRFEHLGGKTSDLAGIQVGAIGPETAKRLIAGQIQPTLVPEQYRAEGILEALTAATMRGKRVLIPRAAKARDILPETLRVTLELEQEAQYSEGSLDGPPRVFVDLRNTGAVDPLKNATLAFPDDIVRQIRVGHHEGTRTRVVLDLNASSRHSIYALYEPYRVVIDFDRPLAAAAAGVVTRPAPTASPVRVATPPPIVAAAPGRVAGSSVVRAALESEIDRHHTIGHTFFMETRLTPKFLATIWKRKIGPLLEEYFFDRPDLATEFIAQPPARHSASIL